MTSHLHMSINLYPTSVIDLHARCTSACLNIINSYSYKSQHLKARNLGNTFESPSYENINPKGNKCK